jgi:phosphate transport system protein
VLLLGEKSVPILLEGISAMTEKSVSMLKRSIEAFIGRNAKAAAAICDEDDQVDRLYEQWDKQLLQYMISHPDDITNATYLIWAGHNLERIADRVTNICERTAYLVTGTLHEVNVSTY